MKKKIAKKTGWRFNEIIGVILMIGVSFSLINILFSGARRTNELANRHTAVVIGRINSTKVYLGNSPVSQQFYYKYDFEVAGKKYTGDSRNPDKRQGDTIAVRYYSRDPAINEPTTNQ